MQAIYKRSVSMKPSVMGCARDVQIDIQKQCVVLLFPNQPAVNFSLEVPDLRCAGQSPAYTYKAWVWCAYINALHAAKVQLGFERNKRLFVRFGNASKVPGKDKNVMGCLRFIEWKEFFSAHRKGYADLTSVPLVDESW